MATPRTFGPALLPALILACGILGCQKEEASAPSPPAAQTQSQAPAAQAPAAAAESAGTQYCDFKGGPDSAPVKVVAFYPGRHEDTLAAVKSLLDTFPGQVQVEIVDWRREEGLKRRAATTLTCAGITINGKIAFDLTVDGKPVKALFQRGMDGEWTKADLEAAVRQQIAAALPPK